MLTVHQVARERGRPESAMWRCAGRSDPARPGLVMRPRSVQLTVLDTSSARATKWCSAAADPATRAAVVARLTSDEVKKGPRAPSVTARRCRPGRPNGHGALGGAAVA